MAASLPRAHLPLTVSRDAAPPLRHALGPVALVVRAAGSGPAQTGPQATGALVSLTITGTPGVSSTFFGPHARRPVLRGLDGDRIRILGNGGASLDASGLGYGHASPVDPIAVDRIGVPQAA